METQTRTGASTVTGRPPASLTHGMEMIDIYSAHLQVNTPPVHHQDKALLFFGEIIAVYSQI
jgi:hypothetical protein